MTILHILKSEPDESVEEILEAFSEEEVSTVRLFEGEVDWAALVDDIFSHDKVICWW
jgi:hypothetical protein